VIQEAYEHLRGVGEGNGSQDEILPVDTLVADGESTQVEFKSTLRRNLHTGEPDKRIELSALKSIAGFLNGHGGTLIIGVADDGTPLGIEEDEFPGEDKMYLHLVNLLTSRLGKKHMMYIHPRFEDYEGTRVLRVDCWEARSPVYVSDGGVDRFYLRTGAATSELQMSEAQAFIEQRF
jgi:predicted HTH transcriptional regulator